MTGIIESRDDIVQAVAAHIGSTARDNNEVWQTLCRLWGTNRPDAVQIAELGSWSVAFLEGVIEFQLSGYRVDPWDWACAQFQGPCSLDPEVVQEFAFEVAAIGAAADAANA